MNIYVEKPFSINEIGKRANNEDATLPSNEDVSINDKLFIVCDGVGGASKGEIASNLACESIQTYFNTFLDTEKEFTVEFIEKAVRYTEIRFDDFTTKNPSARGMATTLCLLYIASNGIFIAHAGDSRVYHIRDGKICFKTEDHSLVNSLVKNGKINPEDAPNHPQKNVILRAIQGTAFPVDIEIIKIEDLQPGDQFLLCTDGLFEVMDEQMICSVLFEKTSAKDKLDKIKDLCYGKIRDNYSAYLIPIQDIHYEKSFNQIFASFLSAFM